MVNLVMNTLRKLEKNKLFWYLLGFLLIFFFLRLPSLIEPNWYGDEGIYQVIGQAINQGRMLYTEAFDNKPPLLYLTYALFAGDQFRVRIFSMIVGLVTVFAFFQLSLTLFRRQAASLFATLLFAILFAIPLIEGNIANAENFMLLPIITAGILIYKLSLKSHKPYTINRMPFLAGLLLGIAFLFKIVAIFDFAAFCIYLLIINFPNRLPSVKNNWPKIVLKHSMTLITPICVGFIAPVAISSIYFLLNGAFSDFIRASFLSNIGYVGYANKFIIPQGLLILKLMLLLGSVALVFLKRKSITKTESFIFLWFVFSLFDTYFSGRPYTHYALMSLPAICLTIGLLLETNQPRLKIFLSIVLIITLIALNGTFKFNLQKTFRYYTNAISFVSGNKDIGSYQSFFDDKTPRDYEIASFIKTHTKPEDNVFIWGDSAQIYSLSKKLPPGRYTVAYHITQYKNALSETQLAIGKANPKYIVVLNESRTLPLSLPNYQNRFVFKESTIYERSN
jgi:hypothetical protein